MKTIWLHWCWQRLLYHKYLHTVSIVESYKTPLYKSMLPLISISISCAMFLCVFFVIWFERSDHYRWFPVVYCSIQWWGYSRYRTRSILHKSILINISLIRYPIRVLIALEYLFLSHPFQHTHVGSWLITNGLLNMLHYLIFTILLVFTRPGSCA